ncbi:cupin domain-containing protein [Edaphobacter aggregans]|uniref:cupin domain-containing protein n=1 Tax=Edaphobacter aggregans TaxID=570835 RepID=UPI00055110F6|nr:cupin domain-containing protein [Edaphobacter aggregans]
MQETIRVGQMSVTFLKTRHETDDTLDMFELTIPPLISVIVPHIHRDYDEMVLGMNGITTWTLNGEILVVGPGEILTIPRGSPHFFANLHDTPARVMCLQTPGVVGPEYYSEIAKYYDTEDPDVTAIGDVMSRYGVIPVLR